MERRRLTTTSDVDEQTAGRDSLESRERCDDATGDPEESSDHVTRPGLYIALIFVASVCSLSLVLYNFPELDE